MRYVIRERLFRLGEDSDITDDPGPVFHVDGKVMTLRDRLVLQDQSGEEIASVHRKLIALRPTYEISIGGQEVAEVTEAPLHTVSRRVHDRRAWPGRPGDDREPARAQLRDYAGWSTVATVSKAWLSVSETYGVDIAPGQNDLLILAVVLALDLALDRERGQAR